MNFRYFVLAPSLKSDKIPKIIYFSHTSDFKLEPSKIAKPIIIGFRSFLHKLANSKKRLFLVDGLGALLTAFCLVAILARFESTFGMPKNVLYVLAAIAFVFALYSLGCYFFISTNLNPYLKGIAIANTLYCCTTILLIFLHYQSLTVLGLGYFLLELVVVGCLIVVELFAVYRSQKTP